MHTCARIQLNVSENIIYFSENVSIHTEFLIDPLTYISQFMYRIIQIISRITIEDST